MQEIEKANRLELTTTEAFVSRSLEPAFSAPTLFLVSCANKKSGRCYCRAFPKESDDEAEIKVEVEVIQSSDDWLRWVSLTQDQILGRLRRFLNVKNGCPIEWALKSARELTSVWLSSNVSQPMQAYSLIQGFDPNQPYKISLRKMVNWKGQLVPIIFNAKRIQRKFEWFELEPDLDSKLKERFSGPVEDVLSKRVIEMERATGIVGRRAMILIMLLTLHSRISLLWRGHPIGRSPLDTLIIGDHGTGKSECAVRMLNYFDLPQPLSGEIASRAGLLGGAVQKAKQGYVAMPGRFCFLNNRAAFVDEAHSFLHSQSFQQTSQWRSSGKITLDLVGCNRSFEAVVRVVWVANPIHQTSNLQTAISDMVTRPEDRRRFDLANLITKNGSNPERMQRPDHSFKDQDTALLLHSWSKTSPFEFPKVLVGEVEKAANRLRKSLSPRLPEIADPDTLEEKIVRISAAVAETTFRYPDEECVHATTKIMEEQA